MAKTANFIRFRSSEVARVAKYVSGITVDGNPDQGNGSTVLIKEHGRVQEPGNVLQVSFVPGWIAKLSFVTFLKEKRKSPIWQTVPSGVK